MLQILINLEDLKAKLMIPYHCYTLPTRSIYQQSLHVQNNCCKMIFGSVKEPSKGCLPNKKRKKIQTIVKKVGGGDPQIQNKN